MPLSENEQRIFAEIEKNLQHADPEFARELEGSAVYKQAFRVLRWPLLGLILGIAFMLTMLFVHYLLAFLGFLLMFVSAFYLEKNFRAIGKAGFKDVSSAIHSYRSTEKKDTKD